MSVNQSWSMNPDKTKHLGPIFHTIDYDNGCLIIGQHKLKTSASELKELHYNYKSNNTIDKKAIYTFKGIELTGNEYNRLCETIRLAYTNINKKIKLGL